MSKKVFELNRSGVRELFQCSEMQTVISEYSSRVASNAGGGYSFDVQTANRAVGRVYPSDSKSKKDNNENNTLLKALHD